MPTYLLRYQAASFDDNVFDTQQLSGVRGASLSYLYSGFLVKRTLEQTQHLQKLRAIYTGASQGAFVFDADSENVAVAARHRVEDALKRPDPDDTGCHDHLAYVVALVEGADNKALLAAESLCNVKKLQQRSFLLPDYVQGASKPGGRRDPRPALPNEDVSAAMKAREKFGREQQQRFYERMSGQRPQFDFTDNLEEIVAHPPDQNLPAFLRGKASLRNKIAVFYADGDKFGQRFRDAAKESLETLTCVSNALKYKQAKLLDDILGWLGKHRNGGASNPYFANGAARFETLLWGGDENLFVMPSWLGLEFAQLFYEKTRDWKVDGCAPWTFSSGLVICNHKTPIRQVKTVAKELADRNKALGGDAIQIEVFESLSVPDVDFDSYRRNLYFADRKPVEGELDEVNHQLSIPGGKIGALIEKIALLKEAKGLPRSQLYRMLQKASEAGAATARSDAMDRKLRDDFALWKKRAAADIDEKDVDVLRDVRPWGAQIKTKQPAFSLSLGLVAMLWDYVRPLDFDGGGRNALCQSDANIG